MLLEIGLFQKKKERKKERKKKRKERNQNWIKSGLCQIPFLQQNM